MNKQTLDTIKTFLQNEKKKLEALGLIPTLDLALDDVDAAIVELDSDNYKDEERQVEGDESKINEHGD